MNRSILGAAAMAMLLPFGLSAQGHGVQPSSSDSTQGTQGMMQQMQERMQAMQQQKMQMQGQHEGMDMQGRSMDMQRMQGQSMDMQGQSMGGQAADCSMTGPERALSSLFLASIASLGLTEAQSAELAAILDRARNDARATLTDEQRVRLDAAPPQQAACSDVHAGHAPGAG